MTESEAGPLSEMWGHYSYATSRGKVRISWSELSSEAIDYFSPPLIYSFSRKSTPKGDVIYMGGRPGWAESVEALYAAVDQFLAETEPTPRPPSQIVFPPPDTEETVRLGAPELRTAAASLLDLL